MSTVLNRDILTMIYKWLHRYRMNKVITERRRFIISDEYIDYVMVLSNGHFYALNDRISKYKTRVDDPDFIRHYVFRHKLCVMKVLNVQIPKNYYT
jgi:hypothetical protein